MKVLHICPGNMFGGVETHLRTLARFRNLCPEMEAHFGVCYQGRLSEALTATGAPVHVLGPARVSRPWTIAASRKRLEEVLSCTGMDAVICHMPWTYAVFGIAARRAGCRSGIFLQNPVQGDHWLERWARRTPPDFVLAVSKDTAATSTRIFPKVTAQVVYSPMPEFETHSRTSVRPILRRELDTPEDATVIIQASRMDVWKGHRFHLEALALIRDRPGWLCWIAGGPQAAFEFKYFDELRAQARQLGIEERVRFLGQRRDVSRLLAAADIFCQPNTGMEGFSWSFMEACAASLPIITSDIGGAPEIIDGSNGVLVRPTDVDGLSRALLMLIENPELRRSMGQAGAQRVQQMCDRKTQINRLYQVLAGKSACMPAPDVARCGSAC